MPKSVLVLNGPNLNLLGLREPEIYGSETLHDVEKLCAKTAAAHKLKIAFKQSNAEGQLIDWIHAARGTFTGLVINPGGLSHTSVALLDALNAFEGPVVEVHVSNIHKREAFRHHSFVSSRAESVIVGCGVQGYQFAVERLAKIMK